MHINYKRIISSLSILTASVAMQGCMEGVEIGINEKPEVQQDIPVISEITTGYDYNGDDNIDEQIHEFFNERGKLLRKTEDYNADDVTDKSEIYIRDGNDNILEHISDFDGDSITDKTISYTYDDSNREIERRYDQDGNGTIDITYISTYNNLGKIATENRVATGKEGETTTYAYNIHGHLISEIKTKDTSGIITNITTWEYTYH